MTLGAAPEALAIGWLRNQRLVRSLDEIAAVPGTGSTDAVVVTTAPAYTTPSVNSAAAPSPPAAARDTVFGGLMDEIDQDPPATTAGLGNPRSTP